MNDNQKPRPKLQYRPGFARKKAKLAAARLDPANDPVIGDLWPAWVPVSRQELAVIETYLGPLLDDLLDAPCRAGRAA